MKPDWFGEQVELGLEASQKLREICDEMRLSPIAAPAFCVRKYHADHRLHLRPVPPPTSSDTSRTEQEK